jgi:hypothetical protein
MGSIPRLPLATKYKAGLKEQMMIGTLNFVQGKFSRRLTEIFVANHVLPRNQPASFNLDSLSNQSGLQHHRFGAPETMQNTARQWPKNTT